jgi:hypothetical protein
MRRAFVAVGSVALLLGLASPAMAGSLSRRTGAVIPGPVLAYAAAAGEANAVTFATTSDTWIIRDQAPVTASPPCGTGDGYTTFDPYCPSEGLSGLEIALGDLDDSADLSGVPAPVVIVLGAGRDTVTTGAKDDAIDARDGEVDTITCGAGTDTVLRDPVDKLAADCESGAPAAATPAPPTGGGSPVAALPKPTVKLTASPQRLRSVLRRGLTVLARAGERPIEARIVVTLPRALAKRLRPGRRQVTAARRFVDLGSFQTRRVRIKLARRVARALARAGRRADIRLAATPVAADGTHGAVARLTVRVKR